MNNESSIENAMTPESVCAYLRAHPDFFQKHPDVLGEMTISHVNDGAVSLVERQVAVLRERNAELRRRLDTLVANAEQNEALLTATQEVIAAIADRGPREEAATLFCDLVRKHFDVELVTFIWCHSEDASEALSVAEHLLGNKTASSGPLRSHEFQTLFNDCNNEGSAALAKLTTRSGHEAVIAVGSNDAARYGMGDGTLFLEYLAKVIASLPIQQPSD